MGPATSSQTHTFKPHLIFKDLVLEIIDLALEEVDLLIEGEDDVCQGHAIHLAPKDVLLHSFKPGLHGSRPLGTWHIAEVKHPLMHLDDLRVLHHVPQIWVDEVLEELVLGGA